MTEKTADLCSLCEGTGQIAPHWPVGPGGAVLSDYTCSACNGTGKPPLNTPERGGLSSEGPADRQQATEETGKDRPAAPISAIEAFAVLVEEIDATGVYLDSPKDAVKFISQCVSSALTKLIQREGKR